jgi:hypothetical protein
MTNEILPSPFALILVTIIKNPRDMEIARLLGWYRIPLRSAPKVISVDYLAFYQTSTFGKQKWQIEYIAPVLGHELTSRAELLKDELDHPHAHQEYYKIQIGPLIPLPNPIPAQKWRRITFFYTTGEYINQASSINDLIVKSEERRILWESLRERASQNQTYLSRESLDFDLNQAVLASLLGFSQINKDQ